MKAGKNFWASVYVLTNNTNEFESYSAGTETKPQINQDAIRLMKEIYGIDMETDGQRSKLISEIPEVDIAISMGCIVNIHNRYNKKKLV